MKLRERTVIDLPAARVWRYVSTPELFVRWNEKVSVMEAKGAFRLGQRFAIRYLWKDREIQCLAEVTALEEERLLEFRHRDCSGAGIRRDIEITERISLIEKRGRTSVTKDVTIRNSGVPWFIIPLICFINRLGKPVQPDKLKTLCEDDAS